MKNPERLTDELLEQLLAAASPDAYLCEPGLEDKSFSTYLNELLVAKDLKKSQVIREAGVDGTYCYQFFNGDRSNPSRDYVIQLAFGLHCSLVEAQRLLRRAGVSELWAKVPRDAVIIYALEHGYSRAQADDDLYRLGFETLVKAEA